MQGGAAEEKISRRELGFLESILQKGRLPENNSKTHAHTHTRTQKAKHRYLWFYRLLVPQDHLHSPSVCIQSFATSPCLRDLLYPSRDDVPPPSWGEFTPRRIKHKRRQDKAFQTFLFLRTYWPPCVARPKKIRRQGL